MIYIVNGTGAINDADYAVEMAGSYCWMIYFMNKSRARYWRGPNGADFIQSTSSIAAEVFQDIMGKEFPPALLAPGQRQSPHTPIYLIGYSRGGAAMVMVAKMLADQKIPVAAMFLFDAVDRTLGFTGNLETVPRNVEKCYHAVRNEGAEVIMTFEERQLWKQCEQAVGYAEIRKEFARIGSGSFENFLQLRSTRYPVLNDALKKWKAKSTALNHFKVTMRNSFSIGAGAAGPSIPFGNCARKHANIQHWSLEEFAGSHGALGGVPWTELGEEISAIDREASRRVWTWMSSKMRESGINAGRA